MADLTLSPRDMRARTTRCRRAARCARNAAARVRAYHERQKASDWRYSEADGTELGQRITPLDRVGIYVPGGKAAYPSSVLMQALPAAVAGVREIVMVVPTPDGVRNPLVLAAAHVAGVTRAYTIGGAQAVAALAYGTGTIAAVDKICGPGNAYVAAAKRRVFGTVGIDVVAGVSEVLVIADSTAHPDWVALDLFAQAEHDELAQAILLTPDAGLLARVRQSAQRLIAAMPRAAIIAASLARRGALIRTRDLAHACEIANRIAPEHLELAVADPDASCRRSVTRGPSSWAITRRRRWAITAPGPITCCPPDARRASRRRSASTTSRSAAACCASRRRVRARSVRSPSPSRRARAWSRTRARRARASRNESGAMGERAQLPHPWPRSRR
jgi:histidinol dehydrogenase